MKTSGRSARRARRAVAQPQSQRRPERWDRPSHALTSETWSTAICKMEKKKPERSGGSIIQILPARELVYLHWMNKLINLHQARHTPSPLALTEQPSSVARSRAQRSPGRSVSWEASRSEGWCEVSHSGTGGKPTDCFHCLASPLVLWGSCLLTNLPYLVLVLTHFYPRLLVQALWFPDLALDLLFDLG